MPSLQTFHIPKQIMWLIIFDGQKVRNIRSSSLGEHRSLVIFTREVVYLLRFIRRQIFVDSYVNNILNYFFYSYVGNPSSLQATLASFWKNPKPQTVPHAPRPSILTSKRPFVLSEPLTNLMLSDKLAVKMKNNNFSLMTEYFFNGYINQRWKFDSVCTEHVKLP